MPDQRSKRKIRFGGYLDRKLYREIVELAKREGMEDNVFGFAQKLIRKAIEQLEDRDRTPNG